MASFGEGFFMEQLPEHTMVPGNLRHLKRQLRILFVVILLLTALQLILPPGSQHNFTFTPPAAHAATLNPIQIENSLPGTSGWNDFATVLQDDAISGYGSKISVNHGDALDFFVTTTAASFTIDIFRTGWYQGIGARLITSLGTFPGVHQAIPAPDPVTGMISCNWTKTTSITIPSTWVTGVYVAKLSASSGNKSFIFFVVRNDGGHEEIVFQTSVTTYQAYNGWGGLSLYSNTLTNQALYPYPHATKVSFDRPFNPGDSNGTGHYLFYEYNFVRWLEMSGYNVTYTTDIDTDTNVNPLTNHKAFLSVGHDEYWSKGMRNNLQNAINAGVNVAFFSANSMYWQIRLDPNAAGTPDRVEVGYRDFATASTPPGPDPMWNVNNSIVTANWRDTVINAPENGVLGVMYEQQVDKDYAYVVQNASSWIYAGTGFVNGTTIPGIVGYEYDKVFNNGFSPPGLTILSNSPVNGCCQGFSSFANSTIYTAPSGAKVFASGTIQWSWGLDNYTGTNYVNAGIQQTTTNILNNFISSGTSSAPGVSLSASSLSFGNQNVGTPSAAKSVTLTNSGTAALTINSIGVSGTNPSDFSQSTTCPISPSTLAAGANCTINVIFTPGANGARSASVSITDNATGSPQSITLSGTGVTPAPGVSLSATSLTYTSQNVGTTSASQSVTVTNNGTAALTISSIGLAGTNPSDFSQTTTCPISPATLAVGANCSISVTFTPSANGARSASVAISDNATGSPQSIALSGTGVTSAPGVSLSATSLTYTNQNVGTTSAAKTVTVTNNGTAALTISSIGVSGTNASDFAQTNTCPISPATLAIGANCSINVTFTPSASGARSASISITDNATGSPQSISLSGTGVTPAPGVNLSATSLTYTSQNVGTTSASQSVTLTNNGTAALTINSIALGGTNSTDFNQTTTCPISPATLAVGANCTISVTFTPSASGARSASVNIIDNATGSPQSVSLSGTGVTPTPGASLSATSLTFASQNVGTTSAAQSVTLTNNGTAALTISSIGVSGTNATDFAQTTTCPISPATLAVGANCSISVTFKPSAAGTRSASLLVTDNAAGSPQTITLTGTGVSAGIYFSDGFETGNFSKWTIPSSDSTGKASVQSTIVNSGSYAASFVTSAGQYTYIATALSSAQAQTFTRFYFRSSGLATTTQLAIGRTTSGNNAWEIDYNASRHGLDIYIWDGANQIYTLASADNALSANVWYSIEIQDNQSTSGHAEVWINGVSVGAVNANLSTSAPYSQLMLYDDAVGTEYFDDVQVGNVYNGPANPQPGASLSATTLTYTSQNVGTTSASQSVTVTNTGAAALTISSITLGGTNSTDFAQTSTCPISPATLAVGANCTISVTFKPSAAGTRSASVNITDNAAGSPQSITLSGTGVTPAPGASLSASSLIYTNQNVGTTSPAQSVTLTNNGTAALTISSIALGGTNSTDFAQTSTCPISPATLAVGANCSISVTFTPGANGARSATISITDNATGSPQSIALSGTGVTPAPGVSLSATSLTYTNQNIGTTSAAKTVTLTNNGAAALSISSITLGGTNSTDFALTTTCPISPATLALGANCSISVTFTPSANGARSATISITDNAPGSPQSISVSGTGVTPAPAVTLSSTSLSFANQALGSTSAAQSVTLTNSGTAALTINGIALAGTNAGDFSQTTTCPISPATLAVGATCSISITFTPSANGSRTASVSLTDNAAGSPQTITLSGTGVTLAPAVTLNPTSLTYSSQNVGSSSAAQTITLTNSGTAALSISGIVPTGTNASDYSQTTTCPISPATLAVGGSCSISVTFKPAAAGSRIASLTVTDNAATSPQGVALSGTGIAVGTYLSDDFESGNLNKWTPVGTTGQTIVQSTVVHAGNNAAAFTNSSGQYISLSASLTGGAQAVTYTKLAFRYSSLSGTSLIATGTDVNGKNRWIAYYDAARHGLDVYFFNGAGKRYDVYSNTNVFAANTWYTIEIYANEVTAGSGQVWLNGTSIGSFTGDLSTTTPLATLTLYNEVTGTDYFDDISVSNTF